MVVIASAADEPEEIDMNSLQRGQTIELRRVKRHLGIFPENGEDAAEGAQLQREFQLQAVSFCKEIERYFKVARGETITVSFSKRGIAILTADEQDSNSADRQRQAVAKYRDALRRDRENDTSALSPSLLAARDRRISRGAWIEQQISKPPPPEMKKKPVGDGSRARARAEAFGAGNGASERGDPAA